jgi:hypothetical protein
LNKREIYIYLHLHICVYPARINLLNAATNASPTGPPPTVTTSYNSGGTFAEAKHLRPRHSLQTKPFSLSGRGAFMLLRLLLQVAEMKKWNQVSRSLTERMRMRMRMKISACHLNDKQQLSQHQRC